MFGNPALPIWYCFHCASFNCKCADQYDKALAFTQIYMSFMTEQEIQEAMDDLDESSIPQEGERTNAHV